MRLGNSRSGFFFPSLFKGESDWAVAFLFLVRNLSAECVSALFGSQPECSNTKVLFELGSIFWSKTEIPPLYSNCGLLECSVVQLSEICVCTETKTCEKGLSFTRVLFAGYIYISQN